VTAPNNGGRPESVVAAALDLFAPRTSRPGRGPPRVLEVARLS
jgi:hypothetical protein